MSMADNRRNRPEYSDDAYESKPQGTPQGDPLAELARLIGQNDPFADVSRQDLGRQVARKPLDVAANDRPAPEWLSRPAQPADEGEYEHPAPRASSAPTRYRDEYRADLASFRPSSDDPHAPAPY